MKGYTHMSYYDRLELERMYNHGLSVTRIAERLGRSRQTIYNELKRGEYERADPVLRMYKTYSADIAQEKHDYNASAKGRELKIGRNRELAEQIEHLICEERRSPYDALCELNFPFCVSTLYSYIDKGIFGRLTNADLWVKAHQKPKVYKKVVKRQPRGTSIDERPAEIAERLELGHWEMDCVLGQMKDKKVLLVFTERYTRAELIYLMPDKTAKSVCKVLNRLRKTSGFEKVFKSITVDNGTEFAYENLMRGAKGQKQIDIFYCHPYCSSERGSNECANKQVRKYFPKGSTLKHARRKDARCAAARINRMHRRLLHGNTAEDVFNAVSGVELEQFYNAA